MLFLILESALRSALLGLCVWAALKLVRLKDPATETMVWTCVLLAAVAMPFFAPLRQDGPALHLGQWWTANEDTLYFAVPTENIGTQASWLSLHAMRLAQLVYAAIVLWNLARLATGLILSWRLCRNARNVTEAWAQGHDIRTSEVVESPYSLGFIILLPADWREWPEAKRNAIIAHEATHVRRGDFFLQLMARLYRAIFWFNPLAWWLTARLEELAETACDEAAIQTVEDRASYAAILVEVSLRGRTEALTAMARKAGLLARVDHILSEPPHRAVSLPLRAAAIILLAPLSFAFATAHAEVAPTQAMRLPVMAPLDKPLPPYLGEAAVQPAPQPLSATPPAGRAAPRPKAAAANLDSPSYNPRALLDEPQAVVLPTVIPVMGAGSKARKPVVGTMSAVSDGSVTILAQPQ
ncbi:MAG TPA: M56 family metallopeptidase [Rhizomicrobium sp.]|jgi:beta-lactamase regulating signal transducer with metallopeptidase domain|nr:M56 family metallopeptidase [Rhizomicrobium sp.]